MMSAIGRNASKVLRASARSGQIQEAVKVAPALQGVQLQPLPQIFLRSKYVFERVYLGFKNGNFTAGYFIIVN